MPAKQSFLAEKLTNDFGSALINVLKNPEVAGEQTKAWIAAKAASEEAASVAISERKAADARLEAAVAKEEVAEEKLARSAEEAAMVAGREQSVSIRENDVAEREAAVTDREAAVTAREEALAFEFVARLGAAVVAEVGR